LNAYSKLQTLTVSCFCNFQGISYPSSLGDTNTCEWELYCCLCWRDCGAQLQKCAWYFHCETDSCLEVMKMAIQKQK